MKPATIRRRLLRNLYEFANGSPRHDVGDLHRAAEVLNLLDPPAVPALPGEAPKIAGPVDMSSRLLLLGETAVMCGIKNCADLEMELQRGRALREAAEAPPEPSVSKRLAAALFRPGIEVVSIRADIDGYRVVYIQQGQRQERFMVDGVPEVIDGPPAVVSAA